MAAGRGSRWALGVVGDDPQRFVGSGPILPLPERWAVGAGALVARVSTPAPMAALRARGRDRAGHVSSLVTGPSRRARGMDRFSADAILVTPGPGCHSDLWRTPRQAHRSRHSSHRPGTMPAKERCCSGELFRAARTGLAWSASPRSSTGRPRWADSAMSTSTSARASTPRRGAGVRGDLCRGPPRGTHRLLPDDQVVERPTTSTPESARPTESRRDSSAAN